MKLQIICEKCNLTFFREERQIKDMLKKYNIDICRSCVAKISASKRPQNTKEYWRSDSIKEKHSNRVKSSRKYKEAILNRNTAGPNNSMFGKKHTLETRSKMSISRTGKRGKSATAWKGGSKSLTKAVKHFCHRVPGWYKRVYQRDGFKCMHCGDSKNKIDAHHIEPMVKLIKRLLDSNPSTITMSHFEKYTWLISQPEIIDDNLNNGITLCRICHILEHKNWGSHINP